MKKSLNFILLIGLVALIFAGCASEEAAPTGLQVDKGTVHAHPDAFMAGIGDTTSSLYYVYTPPGYDAANEYPVIYLLNGFGGNENYFVALFSAVDAADWLLARHEIDPMILVFPSGHTQMGGSFYTNSPHPAVGQSEQHILNIITEVDVNYSTIATPAGRAIGGHSMGGFGAMSIALNNPNTFGNVSVLSGPLVFDVVKALLPTALAETGYDTILAQTGPDAAAFQVMMYPSPDRRVTSMMFAHAAAFSFTAVPGPTTIAAYGVDLPIGIDGQIYDPTWNRWLSYDPLSRFIGGSAASLAGVNVFLDCGSADDLYLHLAHQGFAQALTAAGMTPDVDTYYNTFDTPEGNTIPADHSTQIYEQLKKLLVWNSSKF